MRRPPLAFALIALPLVLAGCASTSGGGTSGGRSSNIALRIPVDANTAMGSRMRLTLHAERVCADAACIGRGYYLVVSNTSGTQAQINYTPVRVLVDGETYEWLRNEDPQYLHPAVGAFVRVPLDEERFRRLADGARAELWLGSSRFPLDARDRAPLRRLLAAPSGAPAPGTP